MAEALDKQIAIADVYAEALFALAQESQQIADVRHELDELRELEASSPDFAAFMSSSALDDDHREAGLERMFRGRLSDVVLNTLLVMNANGRNALLRGLHRAFVLRQEQAAGQVEAVATTAVELSDEEKKQVADTAAAVSGRKPLVEFKVDPAVLGGLILQIGDVRYDTSLRSRLAAARAGLLERGERGLAVEIQNSE